ncbi:MAG: outer membrane lipoprotein-sorting protein [Kiritimatiellae bacterium]|nr:outer membrane lipoprotein-sorting protein [Kiritimatiellia bacterium]
MMIAAILAATALQLVQECRTAIPADVTLKGRIVQRNRRGIPIVEKNYTLVRKGGETTLDFNIDELGVDVTWSDITLDYLWWDDVSFDETNEGESVNGQKCKIVVLKKGDRTVRAWIEEKHGALMQAEEMMGGKPHRRLWGTRIKKFGDRWMANVMETETIGSGHRTKIIVEEVE